VACKTLHDPAAWPMHLPRLTFSSSTQAFLLFLQHTQLISTSGFTLPFLLLASTTFASLLHSSLFFRATFPDSQSPIPWSPLYPNSIRFSPLCFTLSGLY
jgi:hypothetical protein